MIPQLKVLQKYFLLEKLDSIQGMCINLEIFAHQLHQKFKAKCCTIEK